MAELTGGAQKIPGYLNLYWDEKSGKMWLEIDKWDTELLYVTSLPAGVGSNDIGLDRAQLGGRHVVKFQRTGPRVLMVELNYDFRANSNDAAERRAVADSFAQSVLWGFDVQAEQDGRAVVDATSFFLRDAHPAARALARARQGTYRVDPSRCAFYLPRTKGFPKNTEVETTITLTGDPQGAWVRDVVPSPEAITVRQHHSLVELPGPGFRPRAFDPRAGYFPVSYFDYATPVTEPIDKKWIPRHRLQKKNPEAAVSEPVRPIVYYLDRGAPEPIRSALLEGARWWNQAFEAAGFKDAFRVELLPEDADPMDVRYNVINWVHRATRGWSYGSTVIDPRTGEIIKGHVTLGSLRVRQDFLIAEGLLAPYERGKNSAPEALAMSLARLRQLSAHEVGHTLGLSHAYSSSAQNRASVMDYPHPLVKLDANGRPDLSEAYATGIGDFDKVSIAYGYAEFAPGLDERPMLNQILMSAAQRGLTFLTDADARPEGSVHPQAHLWDNGPNATDELKRLMDVRKKVLARFGENNIREGAPVSSLEDTLVPMYLLHRYQTEAAVKTVGGAYYHFALRGDGQKIFQVAAPAEQRQALEAVLATASADALLLPPSLLALLPPRAHGYPRTREDFRGRTGLAFDATGAAESAANMTFGLLLHPQRAARLVQYGAQDAQQLGLREVVRRTLDATFGARPAGGWKDEVQRTINSVALYHLMALAADDSTSAQARAVTRWELKNLAADLEKRATADAAWQAHYAYAAERIRRFESNPKEIPLPKPAEPPPGQPIGCEDLP
jgi:hypothetical protein